MEELVMRRRPYRTAAMPDTLGRSAVRAERNRHAQEAVLVAVDCSQCRALLAVVAAGAEAFCRPCGVWTPSLPGSKRGAVG